MPEPDPVFVWANRAEAALWGIVAIGFAVQFVRLRTESRWRCAAAAIVFAAFGASDIVETHTGAWWRPWWLLAWKGLCIAGMVALLVLHARMNRWTDARLNRPEQ